MNLTRRSLLGAVLGSGPALGSLSPAASVTRASMGLVIHSFAVRTSDDRVRTSAERFAAPARFLAHARSLGAAGVQVGLGVLEDKQSDAIRDQARDGSLYLEGITALPRDQADVARFDAEIRTARRAGAAVVRSVMLSGRRYERFTSLAAFRRFADESTRSLSVAAPVVARHDVRLAIENHKDWRADELLAILKKAGNGHVGVCLDTGNSIALLEDPMEVIEALAPRAFTTHFKDMALEEYRQGFLLAEVPLGTGILDLSRAIRIIRAARTEIRFNLEMITRDPLKVPCLTQGYWATFADLPGQHLARSLALVRDHPRSHPLPRISALSHEEQLRNEDENIGRCLAFAHERLEL
jgi:sugar phosphate isomerase/epimerase